MLLVNNNVSYIYINPYMKLFCKLFNMAVKLVSLTCITGIDFTNFFSQNMATEF